MAKKSKIVKNERRREIVARYTERRAGLKRVIADPASTDADRAAARRALSAQPRDASATRLRSRDQIDGRPRAVYRRFGLSRIRLREQALRGYLPGVTKSSW